MAEGSQPISSELKHWVVALILSALGSGFTLLIVVLMASDGFNLSGASALSLASIALTLACPLLFAYLLVFRRKFMSLSRTRRAWLICCSLLAPTPAFVLALLSIFGLYKG